MKKLFIAVSLLLTAYVSTAQQTFVRKYTSAIAMSDNVLGDWEDINLTVVFNANKNQDAIFYYGNGTHRVYHQLTPACIGTTVDGNAFQIIEVADDSGDKSVLQLFNNDRCLRLLIDEGYYVEFYRD